MFVSESWAAKKKQFTKKKKNYLYIYLISSLFTLQLKVTGPACGPHLIGSRPVYLPYCNLTGQNPVILATNQINQLGLQSIQLLLLVAAVWKETIIILSPDMWSDATSCTCATICVVMVTVRQVQMWTRTHWKCPHSGRLCVVSSATWQHLYFSDCFYYGCSVCPVTILQV